MPDVLPRLPSRFLKVAVQQEPSRDIYAAHERQQSPPPRQRDLTKPGTSTAPAIPNSWSLRV